MSFKTGTVVSYFPHGGYGFVKPDDGGKNLFVHKRYIMDRNVYSLNPGERIRFIPVKSKKGLDASCARLIK